MENMGFVWSSLGVTFLCLGSANKKKANGSDDDSKNNKVDLTVKMAGIPIYELAKTGAEYKGTALGPNMGIICGIFILLSFCAIGVMSAIKKAHK